MATILIITPRVPHPASGADEQDRAEGITQLVRLGHTVHVIAKHFTWQDTAGAEAWARRDGFRLTLIPYKTGKHIVGRLQNPLWLDGAAYEYGSREFKAILESEIQKHHPDVGWLDHSECWPGAEVFHTHGIPVVARSINIESTHFLQEEGRDPLKLVMFLAKHYGEYLLAKKSEVLLAINPQEERWYGRFGDARLLPLRSMGRIVANAPHQTHNGRRVLKLFFSGSSYNVPHNRAAAEFIITKLMPCLRAEYPGQFEVHITGAKLPDDLKANVMDDIQVRGYIPFEDMNAFFDDMDIALTPSFFGAGMQQKIFEPLARGFPAVIMSRGLAGYPFEAGVEYLAADSEEDFVKALKVLQSDEARDALGKRARLKGEQLFGQASLDRIVSQALTDAQKKEI